MLHTSVHACSGNSSQMYRTSLSSGARRTGLILTPVGPL